MRLHPETLESCDAPDGQHRVSAVLIFLNEERFLEEAIASVYTQTYRDWELLLVDDGSTDCSAEIARACAEHDPGRVRYLQHPRRANRGEGAARNLGARAAHGEWVAFLDGDDVWLPDRLERGMTLALAHPDVDMIYGRTQYWQSWNGTQGADSDWIQPHYFRSNRVVHPPELLRRFLALRAAYPCMGSVLVRRRAFLALEGFEESFRGIGQDLVFFAKFCLEHAVYVSEECWDRYRQHPHSMTARAAARDIRRAQRAYLSWLGIWLTQQHVDDARLRAALRAAIRRTERPPNHWRSRVERVFRHTPLWRFQF